MDTCHKLHLLGDWITSILDHPDHLLSPNDCTQTAWTWGHCILINSRWATWSIRFLVSNRSREPQSGLLLTCYRLIALGKVARHNFPLTDTIPKIAHAGDTLYLIGLVVGLILWAFALVWFILSIIMIVTAYPFPFNMGWWGFVFPIGKSQSATT